MQEPVQVLKNSFYFTKNQFSIKFKGYALKIISATLH